jgi:hypothetical protein
MFSLFVKCLKRSHHCKVIENLTNAKLDSIGTGIRLPICRQIEKGTGLRTTHIKEHKFDWTEMLARMRSILILAVITIVVPFLSFELQFPLNVTASGLVLKAFASTNVIGNNDTVMNPNLINAPPQIFSPPSQTDDVNRTNPMQVGSTPGNYSVDTTLPTESQGQTIADSSSNALGGNNVINIPNINISKEQAAKAEQEANVMLEAYNEKVKQEKALDEDQTNQATQFSNTSSAQTCLGGELSIQIDNNTVCLSPYEISIACNPGGSLVGDPLCTSAGTSGIQQPLGQQPGTEEGEQEVIEEPEGQGSEEIGGGEEEEVIEEGNTGEQEIVEDFE